jgi:hypothetical protein
MSSRRTSRVTCKDCGAEIRPITTNGVKQWYHSEVHPAAPILCGGCDEPLIFDPVSKAFHHWIPSLENMCTDPLPRYYKLYENPNSTDLSKRKFIGVEYFDTNIGRYVIRSAAEIEERQEEQVDISPLINLIKRTRKK